MTLSLEFKEAIWKTAVSVITERVRDARHVLHELQESANSETKSTAGDKYETARETLQQEINREGNRLHNLLQTQAAVHTIDPHIGCHAVKMGTVVETDKGVFFISVSLGKLTVASKQVVCISLDSPLGIALLGKKSGEKITVNTQSYFVQNVI
ncbi:MAG: hypothetical protein EOO04_11395 [Chitinophagaceae bacterium]|nr:MAG: hypothetical protein EOO04_11395 [Chitinophagaceae bacterium]